MVDLIIMLLISDLIYMVLIKIDIFGEMILVVLYFLEWWLVLGLENGVISLIVEFMGVGIELKVFVGILNIKFEMYLLFN